MPLATVPIELMGYLFGGSQLLQCWEVTWGYALLDTTRIR